MNPPHESETGTGETLPLVEAGGRLNLSRSQVRALIDAGEITASWEIHNGRARKVVRVADVEALLAQRRKAAESQTGKGRPIKLPEANG